MSLHGDLDLGGAGLADGGERRMFVAMVSPGCVLDARVARCDAHVPQRSATACTACSISLRPIAPMQPTRKVSTCVSLPG